MDDFKKVISEGRNNKDTARNPILISASDSFRTFQHQLNSTESQVNKHNNVAK